MRHHIDRIDIEAAQQKFDLLFQESLSSIYGIATAPGRTAVSGLRHVLPFFERSSEKIDPEEALNERLSEFHDFLEGNVTEYQQVFDTHTEEGSLVFKGFTSSIQELHGIEFPLLDEKGHDQFAIGNSHLLEVNKQNSGSYYVTGSVVN